MATYEIIREAYDVPACWETTLGGQRWWITRCGGVLHRGNLP